AVRRGQRALGGRLAALLVDVDRNAAAVVADGAGTVGVQDDFDVVAEPGQRLVDGVVNRLVNEVVQPVGTRVADVHRRPLADGLEALEDLDVAGGIVLGAHAAVTFPPATWKIAAPPTMGVSGVVKNTCSADCTSRSTWLRTVASSSERASSSSRTGVVPAASVTGITSASRSASATRRCWPREPNARAST